MRALVTGATGFLGGPVCRALLADGHEVTALVRQGSDTRTLDELGVGTVRGCLVTSDGLGAALDGADAVVHAAGGGKMRRRADVYAANAETTRTLLAAARESPVRRLLLVSSLAAHGPAPGGTPRAPDDVPRPVSHYGRSKALAEDLVRSEAGRIQVSILRPPAIYGPGDTRMLPIFRAAARGLVPLPASGRATSLIHVGDCASAIAALLRADHPSGAAYFVEDGAPRTLPALVALIGEAVGRQPRVLRVPGPILAAAGLASDLANRIRRAPSAFGSDKARDLRQPWWVCDAAALRALGWRPRISLPEGLQRTASWYREAGWL